MARSVRRLIGGDPPDPRGAEGLTRGGPRLSQLQAFTDSALGHLDTDQLLAELLGHLREILAADTATILLLDEDGEHLVVRGSQGSECDGDWNDGDGNGVARIPVGRGFAGRIAASRRTLVVDDLEDVELVNRGLRTEEVRALLGTPLLLGDRVVGVVHIGRRSRRRFSIIEVRLLELAAERIALAVDRARLFEAEQQARAAAERSSRRLAFLVEAGKVLAATLDYTKTLENLAELVVPELADGCGVDVVEDDGLSAFAARHVEPEKHALLDEMRHRYPPAQLLRQVVANGEALFTADLGDEILSTLAEDDVHAELLRRLQIGPGMCLPLVARERVLGTMTFVRSKGKPPFSPEEVAVADELADRAALAIDHARTYRDLAAANRAKAESLALLDTLYATAPVGLALWDADLRCVRVNEIRAAWAGHTVEECQGRALGEIFPELADELEPVVRRVLETGVPVTHLEVDTRDAAGELRHWLHNYYPVTTSEGLPVGVGAVIVDITDRKRSECELRAAAAQQEAVASLGQRALAGTPPAVVMDEAAQVVAGGLRADLSAVLELLPGGSALVVRAGVGWREGVVGSTVVRDRAGSLAGYTLASRAPVVISDLRTDNRFRSPVLAEHGVVSSMSVLIGTPDHPLGMLAAHTTAPRVFDADDVNFLQSVANVLAGTIVLHHRLAQAGEPAGHRRERLSTPRAQPRQ